MPSRKRTGAPAQYELVLRRVRGRRYVKTLDAGSKYAMKQVRNALEDEGTYGGYLLCIEKVGPLSISSWNQ